jgi:hypothetical protein
MWIKEIAGASRPSCPAHQLPYSSVHRANRSRAWEEEMISLSDVSAHRVEGSSSIKVTRPRLRGIALPNEHGAWGLLAEPLVAGLAVAFSIATPFIALIFIGAFLIRQPLKLLLVNMKAGRSSPHTRTAFRFLALFGAIFAVGCVGLFLTAETTGFAPLIVVAPFAMIPILYDAAAKSRRVVPEVLGAVVLSSSAAVCASAAGWPYPPAAALSAVFVLRSVPSLLYVRERLKLEKGKPYSLMVPTLAHVAAVLAIGAGVYAGLFPKVVLAVSVVLLTRAFSGLTRYRQRLRAMQIGVLEVVYGAMVVAAVIIGYYFNI